MRVEYDIAIVGGGPAGLTAGLYACRAGMKTLLIEKALVGGQLLMADLVENFPGFPRGVRGPELADSMAGQAAAFGLKTETAEALGISPGKSAGGFFVKLADGKELSALSVIIATGAKWNRLGIPGEDALIGKGVSYCATCDGPLFRGKKVVVVGGGDTALGDAIFLTKFASRVTVVHRRDRLRATRVLQERAGSNEKIELCLNSVAAEVAGKDRVEAVKVRDVKTGAEKLIPAEGVFIFIGITPNSEAVKGLVDMDGKGCVIVDDDMKTSREGVFACGDVRKKLLRQVVTATGDGATAATSAQHYVERLKGVEYPESGK